MNETIANHEKRGGLRHRRRRRAGRRHRACAAWRRARVVLADYEPGCARAVAASSATRSCRSSSTSATPRRSRALAKRWREGRARVDILVNNAGILSNHKTRRHLARRVATHLCGNLDGALPSCRELRAGDARRRWGRIINMCSLAMKTGGLTAGTAYTTSKGALGAFTFSLARELAPTASPPTASPPLT